MSFDMSNDGTEKHCELHGVAMKSDEVRVRYGLLKFEPDFLEARTSFFVNSNRFVMGGCIVDAEVSGQVLYCEKCREAEIEWLKHEEERSRFAGK